MTHMKVELHCHTLVSKDSLMQYDAIIRRVTERGLGALAITDHNRIDGALELAKRAGTSTVARKVSATTGPTPGVVISLRQTSSWRTAASSRR